MNYKKKNGAVRGKKVNRRNDWGKVRAMERQVMNGAEHPHSVLVGNWYGAPRSCKIAAEIDNGEVNDPLIEERVSGWIPWEYDPGMFDYSDVPIPDYVMPEDRIFWLWSAFNRSPMMKFPDPPQPRKPKGGANNKRKDKCPDSQTGKHHWFAEEYQGTTELRRYNYRAWYDDDAPRYFYEDAPYTERRRLCMNCGKDEVTSRRYEKDAHNTRTWNEPSFYMWHGRKIYIPR